MLAQNFKTAAELGISEVEIQSLIKVLGMLERGEIDAAHFSMMNYRREEACGTVGCLCGWAHMVSSAAFPEVSSEVGWTTTLLGERLNEATKSLFAIGCNFNAWAAAEPRHAALALRSYLTTGDARWDLALAD